MVSAPLLLIIRRSVHFESFFSVTEVTGTHVVYEEEMESLGRSIVITGAVYSRIPI